MLSLNLYVILYICRDFERLIFGGWRRVINTFSGLKNTFSGLKNTFSGSKVRFKNTFSGLKIQ